MISFIHTADIHFGVENYGRIDPETGIHTRLLDFNRALNACIDTAIARNVDCFIFSGDAYKTAHPTPTQQRLLTRCFLRLYQHGIPLIIIVGNHDHPLSFGKANALDIFGQFPADGFYVIAKPETIQLQTKHGPLNIVGIPWPTRNNVSLADQHYAKSAEEITDHISQAVGSIIQKMAQDLDPAIPAVLAGHLTVSSGIFSGSEKRAIYGTDPVLLPSQLAISPFDYVALGHLHRYQNLNPNGYPAVVYAGSPERVDFGERKEDKGFCLVTIHAKGNTTHEFIKTPQRPFVQIEVTLNNESDQTEQIIAAIAQYQIKQAVVKVVYRVPAPTKNMVNLKAIHRELMDAHYVVGIIPYNEVAPRDRRITLQPSMNFKDTVAHYFANKPEHAAQKELLVEKTLQLFEEAQGFEKQES